MSRIENIVLKMRNEPNNIRFNELCKVCEHYFGKPRQSGTNHKVYKTPWQGDPRVNIQNKKGKAKLYQVKQVLMALEKIEVNNAT
ncbi:toxin HicA [Candidatus Thiosymbion oneisti]|uniref:toxin HicA n=1 Tax=Candidatus Thiosymbion oneisti TaxID=589554 RepID=UPI000A6CB71B|nr:toxin HicA [Candidatus Thiosymbion oneisti]